MKTEFGRTFKMEINSYEKDGVAVVEIKGRLTAETVEQLRSTFLELFTKHRRFVFDLKDMENLDSTGLGAIVFCLKSCSEFNGTFKLANLADKPRMILEITKAYRIFDIYDSLDEAIKAAQA